jgi:copper/silver efflux system protein
MTVAAIMLGLLPALWSHGTGAEVMQRIAAPMIGGMVTSTILTLVVIPALYYLWRRRGLVSSADDEPGQGSKSLSGGLFDRVSFTS